MPSTTKPTFKHASEAKYLSEFIGTFFLVFTIGCNVHVGSIGAVLSIGGILAVMVYSLGSVSGAHFNPAVTVAIGLIGTGKINSQDFICYIVSQLLGGIVGAVTYLSIFNDGFVLHPVGSYTFNQTMASEVLYTAALCYVVLNVATTEHPKQGNVPNDFFGIAIGLTVTAAAIAIGPLSGCSLNPAVSAGSFAVAKVASHSVPVALFALYFLSPFIGAALAALFFYFVQGGLTNQFEYEKKVRARRSSTHMDRFHMLPGEEYVLTEEQTRRNIFLGFEWKTEDASISQFEVDAALVKYDKDGCAKGEPIYFSAPRGEELKKKMFDKQRGSVCYHERLENAEGIIDPASQSPRGHKKSLPRDNQRIQITSLADLQQAQSRAEYLFFTVSYFSGDHALKNVSIRLCDNENKTDVPEVICKFEKCNITHNDLLMGVLYHNANDQWIFRVIDEGLNAGEHSNATYRQLAPNMEKWVRQLQFGVRDMC